MVVNIREYIPEGKENAVSRKVLAKRTGLEDRAIRDLISRNNKDNTVAPIINLGNGQGYFIATKDDREAVRRYCSQELSRIRETRQKIKNIQEWYERTNPEQLYMDL